MPNLRARLSVWFMQVSSYMIGGGYLLLGFSMCLGGRNRFLTPSLSVAREIPGWPYSWGYALMFACALTLFGLIAKRSIITGVSMLVIAFWLFLFGGFTIASAVQSPLASSYAWSAYMTPAILIGFRGAYYLLESQRNLSRLGYTPEQYSPEPWDGVNRRRSTTQWDGLDRRNRTDSDA